MGKTNISWATDAWNLIGGCSMQGAECVNCYAMQMAGTRLSNHALYRGMTRQTAAGKHVWTGDVRMDWSREALDQPKHWRKPRWIFVCSMADLFHVKVPFAFVDAIMDTIRATPQHTYLLLTKRSLRMAVYVQSATDLPSNVIWGASAGRHETAQERIPNLKTIHGLGHKTFVSYEPAIGPIDWQPEWAGAIDWIICGAESGNQRRCFETAWAESTRDFCLENQIAFWFKQNSARLPGQDDYLPGANNTAWRWHQRPGDLALPEQVVPTPWPYAALPKWTDEDDSI